MSDDAQTEVLHKVWEAEEELKCATRRLRKGLRARLQLWCAKELLEAAIAMDDRPTGTDNGE